MSGPIRIGISSEAKVGLILATLACVAIVSIATGLTLSSLRYWDAWIVNQRHLHEQQATFRRACIDAGGTLIEQHCLAPRIDLKTFGSQK